MAAVRRNILSDSSARDRYVEGARLLKAEHLGPTTAQLGIPGATGQVSTWDLFVAWHHIAMNRFTPPTQEDRNAAHRGPVFLPWHRFMLLLLELQLQRVLDDDDFGLPYWDWAADGELSPAQQRQSSLWNPEAMGGEGDPVTTGPFAFDSGREDTWRIRLDVDSQGRLRSTDRGLRRALGQSVGDLPRKADVTATLELDEYDSPPWSTSSEGFRNRLEGWRPLQAAPGLHNRVHVWIGGDMLPASSPNDPAFYLNHCNCDRLWAAFQAKAGSPPYVPAASAGEDLRGHRIDDEMFALLSSPVTPRQTLDVTAFYTYDSLSVA